MKELVLFEKNRENFYPLSLSHSISELISGFYSIFEGMHRLYDLCNMTLHVPPYLKNVLKEEYEYLNFNIYPEKALYLSSSIFPQIDLKNQIPLEGEEEIFLDQNSIVGFRAEKKNAEIILSNINNIPQNFKFKNVNVKEFNYLWELLEFNNEAIKIHFHTPSIKGEIAQTVSLIKEENIYIGANTIVEDFVVIDGREGPVYISEGCEIKANSIIAGPVFLAEGCLVKSFSNISKGTSLGPITKMSGEISNSICLGYSNKQHFGFLGSSYLGKWINLGAGTTTSNLKNNYSDIKVKFQNRVINTKNKFLGLLCGDHTKSAIGTHFNSGSIVGFGCNIFIKSGLTEKEIKSLSWGPGESYDIKKFLKTAEITMNRRDIEMSESYIKMIYKICELD